MELLEAMEDTALLRGMVVMAHHLLEGTEVHLEADMAHPEEVMEVHPLLLEDTVLPHLKEAVMVEAMVLPTAADRALGDSLEDLLPLLLLVQTLSE